MDKAGTYLNQEQFLTIYYLRQKFLSIYDLRFTNYYKEK